MSVGRLEEAKNLCFQLLEKLGERMSRRFLLPAMRRLRVTARQVRRYTDNNLLSHSLMERTLKIWAMRLLTSLWRHTMISQRKDWFGMSTLLMVKLTLKYGLCGTTAQAFASCGVLLSLTGDLELVRIVSMR